MAFTNPLRQLSVAYVEGSFDIPIAPYTDATGASYKIGSLLTPSGGDMVASTAGTPTTNIAGVAAQAGSGITGTHVTGSVGNAGVVTPLLMYVAADGVVFEGSFASNGGDDSPDASDMFVNYGLTLDSGTGFWYVDSNKTTTNASVIVVGIKQDSSGINEGRVYFKFLRANTSY